jgi:3-polyprenyl-4-hydroxybenzoate decarboxylase
MTDEEIDKCEHITTSIGWKLSIMDYMLIQQTYPQMKWIHMDGNGCVFVSVYPPRYWAYNKKYKRWMAAHIKQIRWLRHGYVNEWDESVRKIGDWDD